MLPGVFSWLVGKSISAASALDQQGKANEFNRKEAEKARQFAATERETAFQDQVRDMRLAGINPIHSAKLGGAAQPASAQATYTNTDPIGKVAQVGGLGLQAALTASQIAVNAATANKLNVEAGDVSQTQPFRIAKIQQEVYNLDLDQQAKGQLFRQLEVMNPIAQKEALAALEALDLSNRHSRADLTRAFNDEKMEKYFDGPAGNWLRLLRGFFNSGAANDRR